MQYRYFLLLFAVLLQCGGVYAQQEKKTQLSETHFISFAPTLQTNGFGLNVKWGRANNRSKFRYFIVDFSKIKHEKEFRFLGDGRYNGFVFGRKNIAMPFNLGMGKYFVLGIRNNKNDIGVAWTYQAGASVAILKPVYLYINEKPGTINTTETLVKYNGENTIDRGNILGGAPFFTGINQLSIVPGIFAKAALLFSWGKYYSDYHVLEVGFLTEVYTQELPLMAHTSNNFIYPSFFINFNMGKYW